MNPLLTITELLTAMDGQELVATWKVLTDIGPDWIGGGRRVSFRLGGTPIDPSSTVYATLEEALVTCFDLPTTTTEVIAGTGVIEHVADRLEIAYEWTRGAPYGDITYHDGRTTLLRLDR